MTLLEKLATIDYPAVRTLNNGNVSGLDKFWNTVVQPYLPKKEIVLQWHNVLMSYIKANHPTFAIRGYNTFPRDHYHDLRRGFLTDTQDFSFFYTDNFFAFYIQKMCLDGFVPSVEELLYAFNNRQFPSRFGINTSEERLLMAVKQGKDPKISAAGFKLAHILPVGKEYMQNDRVFGSKEILECYFPKGDRNDWKMVNDKTGNYYKRQLQAKSEAKRYAIAHFLRFVHPFNYFLCPKKGCEYNDKCKELAEYSPLLDYAHDYMLKTFGDAYREFLFYCMPDARYLSPLFDVTKNNIHIQIGGIMNEIEDKKKKHVQEIRLDFQNRDIKDFIIEHYISHYTSEEIHEAIAPLQINVILNQSGSVPIHTSIPASPLPLTPISTPVISKHKKDMSKSKAIALFCENGYTFCRNVTFSSKNETQSIYWANPQKTFLESNWDLILNDWVNEKLYLFRIPAKAIHSSQIITRSDQPNKIDLQIQYEDLTFTDNRSGINFQPFLIKVLNY